MNALILALSEWGDQAKSIDMTRTLKAASTLILVLGLTACGDQNSQTLPVAKEETGSSPPSAAVRSEPADLPPAAADPEATPEPESNDPAQARIQRQQLRQQRRVADSSWWDDEALTEVLGLKAEQRTALSAARENLLTIRLEGSTRLREQRSAMRAAEDGGNAQRLAELRDLTAATRRELEAAEQVWQDALRQTLSEQQLDWLRSQRPEALKMPASE